MKILFLNHTGGGFAGELDVEEHMTVGKLFARKMPDGEPEDYLIRVNRQPASREQVLAEGDRVTITPVKIEGAA